MKISNKNIITKLNNHCKDLEKIEKKKNLIKDLILQTDKFNKIRLLKIF